MERIRWNDDLFRQELEKCNSEFGISYSELRRNNYALLQALIKIFKNLRTALEHFGFKYLCKRENKTDQQIIDAIKEIFHSNNSLRSMHTIKSNPKLVNIGRKRFGSWRKAVIAAGLDSALTQNPPKWSKEKIIKSLKERVEHGQSIASWTLEKEDRSLKSGAILHFGNFRNALTAAGFNCKDIEKESRTISFAKQGINVRFWDSESLIERILDRNKNKQSIYLSDVISEDSSLYVMSKRLFGSWRKAVLAAGLVYKKKPAKFFGEKIVQQMLTEFFPDKVFERNCRSIPWLMSINGGRLEIDFYCKELDLGIELHGPSHFLSTWGFDKLLNQQKNDRTKRELCLEHRLRLIEIKYTELHPLTLSAQLNKLNIVHAYSDKTDQMCRVYTNSLRLKKISDKYQNNNN